MESILVDERGSGQGKAFPVAGAAVAKAPRWTSAAVPRKKPVHQAHLLSPQPGWSLQRARGGQGSNDWS